MPESYRILYGLPAEGWRLEVRCAGTAGGVEVSLCEEGETGLWQVVGEPLYLAEGEGARHSSGLHLAVKPRLSDGSLAVSYWVIDLEAASHCRPPLLPAHEEPRGATEAGEAGSEQGSDDLPNRDTNLGHEPTQGE